MFYNPLKSTPFYKWAHTILLAFAFLAFTSCKTPSIIATQAIQQGDLANNQNDYAAAIQQYTQYLETAPLLGVMRNPLMEADVNRKLAHAYATQGRYNQSLRYMAEALRIDENEPDNLLKVIEDYRQIGITHVYLGQYEKALISLNKALELNTGMESSIKSVKKQSIADTYLSKAQLELTMGLFENCYTDVHKASAIYVKEDPNGLGMTEATLLLSKLSLSKSETDSARFYIEESIRLAKHLDHAIFRQLQVLGDIQLQLGHPENAVLSKQAALDEAKTTDIKPQIIWAHIRLGDVYEIIGDSKKADEQYKKANSLQRLLNQPSSSLNPSLELRFGDVKNAYDFFNQNGALLGTNIAGLKLAESKLNAGETDSLENFIMNTHQYFAEQHIVEGQAKANLLLSIFYQSQLRYEEALDLLEKTELLNVNPEAQWKLFYNKGVIAKAMGNFSTAEKWFDRSISIIETQRNDLTRSDFRWHYLDSKIDVYDSYVSMLLNSSSVSDEMVRKAFDLNERARSRTFLDMLVSQSFGKNDTSILREQELNKKLVFLKNQIEDGHLKGFDTNYLETNLETIRQAHVRVLQELEQSNPSYVSLLSANPIALNELMQSLDNQTALLEFWVGKKDLITWKITHTGISYKLLKIDKTDLHKQVVKTRNLIKFGIQDKVVGGFSDLHELLSPAFQGVFDTYKHVGIIPHGPLHFIPFEALYGENAFLIEKADMFYAPSASVYYFNSGRNKTLSKQSLLGLALGQLQLGGYTALPGTALELEQLAQFYDKNQCFYEKEISESYFKQAASNYDLIHLATHGVMNTYNPGKSYVLMAPSEKEDGQLTVEEIFDLHLNTQFVTLSACETGLGDLSNGDELIGLSRAFMYAGTSAVIVSLWNVDDISTSLLMTKMHQLVDAGVPLPTALAQAQRDLIQSNFNPNTSRGVRSIEWNSRLKNVINSKETKFASPYFWAPFIIIGNPFAN